MSQLYKITQQRHEKLMRALKGNYFVVWECQWDRAVRDDPEVEEFVRNFNSVRPLQIRQGISIIVL